MAEVLTKTKKYINGEEALLSKQGSSSTRKEKSRDEKKRYRSPRSHRERERSPRRDREKRAIPEEKGKRPGSLRSARSGIAAKTLASAVHPPDRLGVPNPNRGATRDILAMALSDEVKPDKERHNQILQVPQRSRSSH